MKTRITLPILGSLACLLFVPASSQAMPLPGSAVLPDDGLVINVATPGMGASTSVKAAQRACAHYKNRHQRTACMHKHGM